MNNIENKIYSCCPYCGEEYMFNKIKSKKFYDEHHNLIMVISSYYCDRCNNASKIIHDLTQNHSYGEY